VNFNFEFASLHVASVTGSKMSEIFCGGFLINIQYTVMLL